MPSAHTKPTRSRKFLRYTPAAFSRRYIPADEVGVSQAKIAFLLGDPELYFSRL